MLIYISLENYKELPSHIYQKIIFHTCKKKKIVKFRLTNAMEISLKSFADKTAPHFIYCTNQFPKERAGLKGRKTRRWGCLVVVPLGFCVMVGA